MTEQVLAPASTHGASTAGQLLRQAREAKGMHIAALSVAVKVNQRKLEALEGDRLDELPDATFARALAQSLCRHLQTDPVPILAMLPKAGYGPHLEKVSKGINEPFRGNGSLPSLSVEWSRLVRPFTALTGLALMGILAVAFWPRGAAKPAATVEAAAAVGATASAASEALAPLAELSASMPSVALPASASSVPPTTLSASSAVVKAPAAVMAAPAASSASAVPVGAVPDAPVVVQTSEESWVEVRDGRGKTLVSRMLAAGETLAIGGVGPYRVKLGNVKGATLYHRGQSIDLTPYVKTNVARLNLK